MRSLLPLAFAIALGCVDKGPSPTHKQIDPAYIDKNLLSEPPAQMTNTVNATIGDKVVYLGNDVQASKVAPGDKVTVVHYWQVLEPPGERWRVFAHLLGTSPSDWQNLDYTDMRHGHGPGTWQAGEIIRDEQEFRIPDSWSSNQAQIVVGLYPRGGHTAKDRMAVVSGPKDSESRVPVARFAIEHKKQAEPAAPVAGSDVIRKASGPIVIDGRDDDDAWKKAPESPAFTTAQGSPDPGGDTHARMLWDDEYLYVFIESSDPDVFSPYHQQDEPLWKEDVVELFIDADGNRRGYVELQVNPNNAHFDAWFASTRAARSDVAWNANMKSAVTVHGSADNRDDRDTRWDAEIAIPWAAVKGQDSNMAVTLPPNLGDTWRLNVVRIDKPRDGRLAAASWNPITYQDFHALDRMLEVRFGDAEGKITPAQPGTSSIPAGPEATTPGAQPATPAAAQPAIQPGAQAPGQKPPGQKPAENK